jgi:large conductance mechanosensitive channel
VPVYAKVWCLQRLNLKKGGYMAGFKRFIMRGNVIDLAVAVIIGAAFGGIVDSMTKDIITPIIGMIGGQPDFSAFKVGSIAIGNFINALIAFFIKAVVVYFAIVKPFTALMKILNPTIEEKPVIPPEIILLTEIRDILKNQKVS